VAGSFQDKDGDGLVAWYPDPKNPNEKPPKGQDPATVEVSGNDKPSEIPSVQNAPLFFGGDSKPYASISSVGEATAEFQNEFLTVFGGKAPKELTAAFAQELRNLQASRSNKRVGKNEDIVIQGVSPQERKDILNKYLKNYATQQITLANAGDAKAKATLQRGNFGLTLTTLKNAYADNGLPINIQSLSKIATESTLNPDTLKANINLINMQAKTYFPALADKIDKGYTVKQLLTPYINTRANILEEDPDSVDVSALKSVASDPKGLMGLYDYEISLRKDPKWRYTKNAQDSLSGLARDMTKMFGLGA
jgi:hypothetical protein